MKSLFVLFMGLDAVKAGTRRMASRESESEGDIYIDRERAREREMDAPLSPFGRVLYSLHSYFGSFSDRGLARQYCDSASLTTDKKKKKERKNAPGTSSD